MRLVVLGVLEEDAVHVGGGVLEEFVVRVEDDERDLAVAEHRELVGLLHEAELALREGHLRRHGTQGHTCRCAEVQRSDIPHAEMQRYREMQRGEWVSG